MGETPLTFVGLSRLNIAQEAQRTWVVAGTARAAWFENFDDDIGGGARLEGLLAASYSPLPQFSVGAKVAGRLDWFAADEKVSKWGSPEFVARYAQEFADKFGAGVQAQVGVVTGRAPSVQAVSALLTAMFSYSPTKSTTLGAELGYYFDQSDRGLDQPDLKPSAPITLEASAYTSIPWGLGVSQRFGNLRTEWLLETTGRILVGAGAPSFGQSPWLVSVGARHPVSRDWSISGTLEGALSGRPETLGIAEPQPIPARLGASVTVLYRPVFTRRISGRIAVQGDAPPPQAIAVTTAPSSELTGRVIDEGGRPLADAEVRLLQDGRERTERTYADGTFRFAEVVDATEVRLRIATPGYDQVDATLAPGAQRFREVVLYPATPAGQVRGEVKTMNGEAIAARISVQPGSEEIQAHEDGSFEFELAPGRYTITFEHDDFSLQRRVIVVEDHGVVILNIALTP